MKKFIVFNLLFTILFLGNDKAQSIYSSNADSLILASRTYIPDQSLVKKYNPRSPLWLPIVESICLNLALGSFNYLTGSEFARIGPATIKHNFERGWSTDADGFLTNMFAHPFHGSIYYNLARSNGYNYWTSLAVGAIGSWQWEFFMENEPPAWNDWIMTSYGGSMIGEIFYRFSNLILDESATGSERVWREIGAGIFNPGRLFTRLVAGRTSRITNEKLYEKRILLGEISLGGNNVADGTKFKNGSKSMMLAMDVTYGTIFYEKKIKPFDFFRFNLALNLFNIKIQDGMEKQPMFSVFRIYNIFYGKTKRLSDNSRLLWGIFGHYDFLNNSVYNVGGASVGLGIGYKTPPKKSVQYVGILNVAALLMGGANSDFAPEYKVEFLDSARTYNMGPGGHIRMENIIRFSFGSLYLGYSFWWIHTWDGAPGDELIGMFRPQLRIRIYENWYLGFEYLIYHRRGLYDNYENKNMQNNEQRLFVGYGF